MPVHTWNLAQCMYTKQDSERSMRQKWIAHSEIHWTKMFNESLKGRAGPMRGTRLTERLIQSRHCFVSILGLSEIILLRTRLPVKITQGNVITFTSNLVFRASISFTGHIIWHEYVRVYHRPNTCTFATQYHGCFTLHLFNLQQFFSFLTTPEYMPYMYETVFDYFVSYIRIKDYF